MYNFFVLGIVPGTDIRINFQMWLGAAVILAIAFSLWMHRRNYAFELLPTRQPLHASRLHQRG